MSYLENLIASEDPSAVEHDLRVIALARKKDLYESGWEDLQDMCKTKVAKSQIHNIEMRKYHREEYACGML